MVRPNPPSRDIDVRTGHCRRRGWDGLTPGVHVPGWADDLHRLRAWALVLPPGAAFTGLTAAAVQRWWLPPLPPDLPVFALQNKAQPRPRRQGLRVFRGSGAPPVDHWYGLPVTLAPETLLACARVLALLDLVVVIDGALHSAACSLEELHRLSGGTAPVPRAPASTAPSAPSVTPPGPTGRRPGVVRLRQALALADGRSESPWESLLRVLHETCGIEVEPQARITLPGGVRVRADLRLVGTRALHEYDGAHHRSRDGHRDDLRRDRRLLEDGWSRRGYTSADLLHRPVEILREADAAVGRHHDPGRIEPWLGLLRESLFSRDGRAAFRARLGMPQARLRDEWSF